MRRVQVYRLLLLLCSLVVISIMCFFNVYFGTMNHEPARINQVSHGENADFEIPHLEWRKFVNKRLSRKAPYQEHLILFYTEFYGTRPWKRRYAAADDVTCAQNTTHCQFTYDKERFVESHAVIFHAADIPKVEELQMLSSHPVRRKQVWVYFNMENPTVMKFDPLFDNLFNLSMSYRLDSDIHFPYRHHERRIRPLDKALSRVNFAKNKTKQIAWLVDHCGELRDLLAEKLDELGLSIDIGGKCQSDNEEEWDLECEGEQCTKTLQKYKFYFALENYFCKDYVTENYWYHAFENNMVPIVLGGANYHDPLLAIPGSFINVFDFKNPQKLTEHVQALDANMTLYNSYFKWKRFWKVTSFPFECEPALKKLCGMLQRPLPVRKVPFSVEFGNEGQCHKTAMLFRMWLIRS